MPDYTYVEVEPNPNSAMSANQVFKNLEAPFPAARVRVYEGEPDGLLCDVVGWSSASGGTPVQAFAVHIEDSSEGAAYLVYGADGGIRLRPAGSDAPWDVSDASQWGEPYLVLADAQDIVQV